MLSYQYNEIERVEHVEGSPELVFLDFYANCLTSLQGLSPLRGIRVLMLGRNRLSHLSGMHAQALVTLYLFVPTFGRCLCVHTAV